MLKIKAAEEQTVLCKTWMQSGLSKMEFCRQNNLNRSSFYKWLKQFRNDDGKKTDVTSKKLIIKNEPIKFLKVGHAIPQRSFPLEPGYLEIVLANGVNFKLGISQSDVNNLLKELLKWK